MQNTRFHNEPHAPSWRRTEIGEAGIVWGHSYARGETNAPSGLEPGRTPLLTCLERENRQDVLYHSREIVQKTGANFERCVNARRQNMSSLAIESRSMEERGRLEKFSLLGGPLHRLGRRLGLVRGETNTVAVGLALGLLSWSILLALASIGGVSDRLFSLSAIAVDVRLLVVIPLFFLCESSLDPRLRDFVSTIVDSGVVPSNALPALESEIARTVRWKDAWLPEAMCLLAAALLSLFAAQLHLSGKTAALDPSRALSDVPLAGLWDRLPAALSLPDVSLDLADRPLVPLPLALGETGSPPRADSSRRCRGARIPGNCADPFHRLGAGDLNRCVRIVRRGNLLRQNGLRGDLPRVCAHSYYGTGADISAPVRLRLQAQGPLEHRTLK